MSQTYYAILTAIGEAKLAKAAALGTILQLTQMAVGDGNGATPQPSRTQTALVHENRRGPLNSLTVDPANPSQIVAEHIIPEDIGGWWIREIGLYDVDGDLCAVANCPDSYKPVLASGSGRTQIIRMVLIVSDTTTVQLKVDSAVVLASRSFVEQALAGHESRTDPHPLYATKTALQTGLTEKLGKTAQASDSAALEGHPAAYFATSEQLGKAAGIPLLFPLWCPNRAAIPAGYAPADGQTLARSLYPDAWAGIAAGNVPVATDAAWLATPTERGKFTAGDGSTTFRLPDYNGKSAGSLGAVFMRGDGALSAGTDGMIQGDAIRNIVGEYCDDIFRRSSRATGPFVEGAQVTTTGAGGSTGASYSLKFDASRQVPTAPENRPLNVTGCWVIRLFGAVVNPGAADAAQLATEVSKLGADKVPFAAFLGANQSLAGSGYQKLPGGMILQWGVLATPGVNTTMPVTFPVSFPAACRFVGLSGIAGTIVGGSDGGCYATSLTSAGFGLVNGWDGGINPATVYWFAIGY